MDISILFISSIFLSLALFGAIFYFMQSQFKKLQEQSQNDKKDEILTKWLENMQGTMDLRLKNVKKHISDISKKYILPSEGTVDFALMYIPSEAIYYEVVVNNPELGKYSWSQRVLPVSPNVFYSYLKAILIGLEGKKVESRAKEILAAIRSIKEDSIKFSDSLRVMTKHISNAKNSADDVTKNFERLDNRIGGLDNIGRLGDKKSKPIIDEQQELLGS